MNAIQTTSRHPVSDVVFSPDGATMAVAQPNYGVTLHDRATGQTIATVPVPRVAHFSAAAFCDGGTKLAIGSRQGLHIFDAATGRVVWRYGGRDFFRPQLGVEGTRLITANEVRVQVVEFSHDRARPSPRLLPFVHVFWTPVLALSADGRLGIGRRGVPPRPALLDLESGRVIGTPGHPHRGGTRFPSTFTFAPNGERFAVCDGDDIAVYATTEAEPEPDDEPELSGVRQTGGTAVAPKPRLALQPIFTLARPEAVSSDGCWQPPVAFTPDGRGLLVRRPRNRVQLWDVAIGCKAGEWSWRLEWVTCLAVAPDGLTAAAGGRFGRVVVWDLE